MRKFYCLAGFLVVGFSASAQYQYYVPTHYEGVANAQLTSARASGMGMNTITLDGIETAYYNPATISPGEDKLNLHLNYASGDPINPKSRYPFIGLSYRINSKLSVGASMFKWIDHTPVWKPVIGTFNESVDRKTETAYSVYAAYQFLPGLHVGVSGNYLVEEAVPGTKTSSDMIFSVGAIYDRPVKFLPSLGMQNQKIRFAGSFVNALMKNKTTQQYLTHYHYRDVHIHLNLGTAYKFSLPFKMPTLRKFSYFDNTTELVDLGLHLQYRNVLAGPDPQNGNHTHNSHIGVGAEAWFMQRIALRMGYYTETRPEGDDPDGGYWMTGKRRGFTWGYGTLVPIKDLTKGRIPVNAEVNFVTGRLLNEFGKNITPPAFFTKNKFSFLVGVNLKWAK